MIQIPGKNKRKLGSEYEQMAVDYLAKKGYELLEQNYRNSYGEIDLILKKNSLLVFCEIKYRSSLTCGGPLEAVDWKKQKRISRVALHYRLTHGYRDDMPCRFDVVGIYGDGSMCHVENAFDYQ